APGPGGGAHEPGPLPGAAARPPRPRVAATVHRGWGPGRATAATGASTRLDDHLEQAVELEHLQPALLLELAPATKRVLRQPDPLRVRIREPEDARAAVARASIVADLELLVDRDLPAASGKSESGREAPHP